MNNFRRSNILSWKIQPKTRNFKHSYSEPNLIEYPPSFRRPALVFHTKRLNSQFRGLQFLRANFNFQIVDNCQLDPQIDFALTIRLQLYALWKCSEHFHQNKLKKIKNFLMSAILHISNEPFGWTRLNEINVLISERPCLGVGSLCWLIGSIFKRLKIAETFNESQRVSSKVPQFERPPEEFGFNWNFNWSSKSKSDCIDSFRFCFTNS